MPDYTVVEDNPFYMTHESRQRGYETHCDGCGQDLGHRWPHGMMLTVLTDRSGSEQASGHSECVDAMIDWAESDL